MSTQPGISRWEGQGRPSVGANGTIGRSRRGLSRVGRAHSTFRRCTPAPIHLPDGRGFTLLEVILALGLTAVVLALVGTAVNSTLRTIDSGRRRTEREQLARAIMHRIADDLRAVVRYEPFDDSGLNSNIGGISGSTSTGTSTTNQTGNNTSSSQNSNTQSNDQSQPSGTTEEAVTLPIAGIYGSQNYVQVDITRIPRLDEYLYADGVTAPLSRGDVRTVTYYLGGLQNSPVFGGATTVGQSSVTTAGVTGGLCRLEADRMASLWRLQAGTAPQNQDATMLAPEVASLEFRYFDGAMWYPQWDSTAMNGVPRAVEISIYFYDDLADPQATGAANLSASSASMNNPDNFYRMVVHLPAGLPLPAVQTATDPSQQNSNSSTSNSSSGTTSGSPQNGGP